MIDLMEAKELAQILDFRDQSDAANMMRLLIQEVLNLKEFINRTWGK